VASDADLSAAVAELRTPQGRQYTSSSLANPPDWESLWSATGLTSSADSSGGLALNSVVSALRNSDISTFAVQWLKCDAFSLVSNDTAIPEYYSERYDLYRHKYMLANWAFVSGISKLEEWIAPDRDAPCLSDLAIWIDTFQIQSSAVRDAFADLNADVAAGLIDCPIETCPLSLTLAAASFEDVSPNSTLPWLTLSNAAQTSGGNGSDALSLVSYGKNGSELSSYVSGAIKSASSAYGGDVAVIVTEYGTRDAASEDAPQAASRLAAQTLELAVLGVESYALGFFPSGDTTKSAEAYRAIVTSLSGDLTVETFDTLEGIPVGMTVAVSDDGRRHKTISIVNDADIKTNVTVNVTQWGLPLGETSPRPPSEN
jgi:hypothetical protein